MLRRLVPPNVDEQTAILRVDVRGKKLAPDVDRSVVAQGTPGFSGAELANLANEAAIFAAGKPPTAYSSDRESHQAETGSPPRPWPTSPNRARPYGSRRPTRRCLRTLLASLPMGELVWRSCPSAGTG